MEWGIEKVHYDSPKGGVVRQDNAVGDAPSVWARLIRFQSQIWASYRASYAL